jgi:hypothetical protein
MITKFKKFNDQNKTVWDIVKLETGKTKKHENICTWNIDGKFTSNHQDTADTFNQHFLSVAESTNTKKKTKMITWKTLDPFTICYNLLTC